MSNQSPFHCNICCFFFLTTLTHSPTQLTRSLARLLAHLCMLPPPFVIFFAVLDRAFELVLMVGLPGKKFYANPTATGHIPVYKANGMFSYLVTLATLVIFVSTEMYDYTKYKLMSCF